MRGGCRGKVSEVAGVSAVAETRARGGDRLSGPELQSVGLRLPRRRSGDGETVSVELEQVVGRRQQHSDLTAERPRRWKRSAPRLLLICPKTGSTLPWRLR